MTRDRDRVLDASFGGGVFAAATSGARVLVRGALEPGRPGRAPEAEVGATRIAVDPGAGWIALGFKDGVELYRLRGGVPDEHEQPLAGATRRVERIALARGGRLAAALPGGAVRLWGAPPRARSFVDLHPPGRPGSACALDIAADGRTVAAAYAYGGACGQREVRGGQAVLWRGKRSAPSCSPAPSANVVDVDVRPQARTLAAAGTDAIGVWDVAKGRLRESLPAGADAVAFSADGRWLASSGADGSVRLGRRRGQAGGRPAADAAARPRRGARVHRALDARGCVPRRHCGRLGSRELANRDEARHDRAEPPRASGERWRRLTVRSRWSTIVRPRGRTRAILPRRSGKPTTTRWGFGRARGGRRRGGRCVRRVAEHPLGQRAARLCRGLGIEPRLRIRAATLPRSKA